MIMPILYTYLSIALLLAIWFGWNMYRKLDFYDWAYWRSDIWLDFGMRVVFWPLVLIRKPSILLRPSFKQNPYGIDLADRYRQRDQFMKSPPACGATVSYRPGKDNGNTDSEFLFRAADVEDVARKTILESPNFEGMRGAALWTSLRNEAMTTSTPVPEILVNFDKIVEDLIQAGLGHVHCPHCKKQYSVTELDRKTEMLGGWVYAKFICPAKHSIFHREVMHLLRKRNND